MRDTRLRVAVVGAGMAGAVCARGLANAGHEVQVFDKSRGVGGRMATRRVSWQAEGGAAQPAGFDHGAPGFTARAPEFLHQVEQAQRDGLLRHWRPRVAPDSYAPLDDPALWVPTSDMPAWCRAWLGGLTVHKGHPVQALSRGARGWQLAFDAPVSPADAGADFDAVLLATPLPQAARLLQPHHQPWAHRAEAQPMSPCWALMGMTDDADAEPPWDLAWPTSGPLACIIRNDTKPGRTPLPGVAQWVLHATTAWSQTHLEMPAAEVQAHLQQALADWLRRPLTWRHVAVHRWRYASVPRAGQPAGGTAGVCWWDAALGLGVCGDALGGGGVEGAWRSGRELAALVDQHRPE
jgi:hypothetical protein